MPTAPPLRSTAVWWPLGLAAFVPVVVFAVWWPGELALVPWQDEPMNPSQAIMWKDYALAVHAIEQGADPNREYEVNGRGSEAPHQSMTPLAAATRMDEEDVVAVLKQLGATR